ncbi:MAG: PilZ domain-containing protein [Magnetovibrio sp.]|nr:PilZ domain-containing protein [Magnetovibrio sp.]
MSDGTRAKDSPEENTSKRHNVRLTTVFGGRICQYGRAYECIISDVSIGGAKIRLKNPDDFSKFTTSTPAQLIFERLSDYKSLNADVAWLKLAEHVVGLKFSDSELRRRVVLKRLMPNRWRIANEGNKANEEDIETV